MLKHQMQHLKSTFCSKLGNFLCCSMKINFLSYFMEYRWYAQLLQWLKLFTNEIMTNIGDIGHTKWKLPTLYLQGLHNTNIYN